MYGVKGNEYCPLQAFDHAMVHMLNNPIGYDRGRGEQQRACRIKTVDRRSFRSSDQFGHVALLCHTTLSFQRLRRWNTVSLWHI